MSASEGFVELLKDTMRGLGPVSVRRMFGGAGIYADGVMFGLIADDTLYLKADEKTKRDFEAEGLGPFVYEGGGRTLIVGSGNLTPGGLMNNFEAYTIVSVDRAGEFDVSALDEFLARHAEEIRSIDDEVLERAARNLVRPIKYGSVELSSPLLPTLCAILLNVTGSSETDRRP